MIFDFLINIKPLALANKTSLFGLLSKIAATDSGDKEY